MVESNDSEAASMLSPMKTELKLQPPLKLGASGSEQSSTTLHVGQEGRDEVLLAKPTSIPSSLEAMVPKAWNAASAMKALSCFSIRGTAVREHLRERPAVQLSVREDLSLL